MGGFDDIRGCVRISIVERSEIEPSLSILSYLRSLLRIINHPPNSNISILFDILPSKLLLRIAFFSK